MIAALPLVTSTLSSLLGPAPAPKAPGAAAGGGDSFSTLLSSLTSGTVNKMKASEQMSIAGIGGSATTQAVVEAVMQAQEALQTGLAVRDKAVAAFQDISRMPI